MPAKATLICVIWFHGSVDGSGCEFVPYHSGTYATIRRLPVMAAWCVLTASFCPTSFLPPPPIVGPSIDRSPATLHTAIHALLLLPMLLRPLSRDALVPAGRPSQQDAGLTEPRTEMSKNRAI